MLLPLLKVLVLVHSECVYCAVSGAGVPTLQRVPIHVMFPTPLSAVDGTGKIVEGLRGERCRPDDQKYDGITLGRLHPTFYPVFTLNQ